MSEAQVLLKELQDSIMEKPEPSEPAAKPVEETSKSASDFASALLQLPKLNTALDTLTREIRQGRLDALEPLRSMELSIQTLVSKTEANLVNVDKLNTVVSARLRQFDKTEARYENLIDRVSQVLDQLEAVLKRL